MTDNGCNFMFWTPPATHCRVVYHVPSMLWLADLPSLSPGTGATIGQVSKDIQWHHNKRLKANVQLSLEIHATAENKYSIVDLWTHSSINRTWASLIFKPVDPVALTTVFVDEFGQYCVCNIPNNWHVLLFTAVSFDLSVISLCVHSNLWQTYYYKLHNCDLLVLPT